MNRYKCRVAAAVIASAYVLRTLVPRPGELLAALLHPHTWVARVGPDAAAGTVCGALLWLVALWLSFGMIISLVALAPGRLGVLAHSVASRVTPAVLRRVVIATAGASIIASPATAFASSVGASPAPAGTSASMLVPSAPGPILPTDQPSSTTEHNGTQTGSATESGSSTPESNSAPPAGEAAGTLPALGWPVDPAPPPITGHSARAGLQSSSTAQRVTVQPGDSLWSIAAHRLGPASSEDQIQAEWPRWYAVNRGLIGADPDLLLAGAELSAPQPANSTEEK
jgi:hypothetical protein